MAQLAVHPSSFYGLYDPLEDPVRDPKRPDSLRAPDAAAPELHERMKALRARVRKVYCAQLLAKLTAIVAQCRAWGVRVLVLPEYSVPWDVLPELARLVDETMVLVAGTHTVTRASSASKVHKRLGGRIPRMGEAVCPVLHRGKLLALHGKLNPAKPEQQDMRVGDAWSPVAMPEGMPGPMGVLVCLDFLYRESPAYRAHVAEALMQCRFLAVPSLTPHHTLPEFESKAWEEARRYKRPVLYCDTAEGGGTAVYVDEGRAEDLRVFPSKSGLLERGDEGVIVCDVDLGYERRGESTGYDWTHPVEPFAAASLVYRTHPAEDRYATWLSEYDARTASDDDDALEAASEAVEAARVLLTDAMSLPGRATRQRRLRALLRDAPDVTSLKRLRCYTREVVLPPEALPLPALEGAMANACAESMFAWAAKWRGLGLDEVGAQLREAAKGVQVLNAAEWTDAARRAIGAVERAVREPVEEKAAPAPVVPELPSLPTTFDPATFEDFEALGWRFLFRRRVEDGLDLWTPKKGVRRVLGFDPDPEQPFVLARYGKEHGPLSVDRLVERLRLLAIAQGVANSAVLFCVPMPMQGHRMMSVAVLMARRDGWHLRFDAADAALRQFGEVFARALAAKGFGALTVERMHLEHLDAALPPLRSVVDGARATIEAFRERKLREVSGVFIDTDARVDGQPPTTILATLDDWLASDVRTALVLGSFGAGKSTALAQWCHALWQRDGGVRPVLVNLATARPERDAIGMLLDASGADDTPQHRATMTLLVQRGHVLPCFDGFDELSTRATDLELPGKLQALLSVVSDDGRVIVSSREHYFSHEQHLIETSRKALIDALGASASWRRITILELGPAKVRDFVRDTQGHERAREVLARIEATYDLGDLVKRPLLLAMVLATIDRLDPKKRVATSDLYEQYLQRWLEQTRAIDGEVFTDEQKRAFAEQLAVELWRSGQSSIPWGALDEAVTRHLGRAVPVGVPHGAEWLEMRGGAFFVREGEDRYRFAHRSFLEYFLARALVGVLPRNAGEALRTRPLTREVIAFVGEILSARGDVEGSDVVRATQRWLTAGRTRVDDEATLRATATAAANALRLLLGLASHVGSTTQWVPEKSDLRLVEMPRSELSGARLARVRLDGATLSGSDLREAVLTEASLVGAQMVACRLDGATLDDADLRRAVLQRSGATGAKLRRTDLRHALLRASGWEQAAWMGARAEDAEVTASAGCKGTKELPRALAARILEGHRGGVTSVSWSPQGDRVASGGMDGTVRLWDAASGALLTVMAEGHNSVLSVSWSPRGGLIASCGDNGSFNLWQAATGTCFRRLEGHKGNVRSVSWSPEGDRIASGGEDKSVRLWRTDATAPTATFPGLHPIWSVAWSPQGDRVASGDGFKGTLVIWDVASGAAIVSSNEEDDWIDAVSWSPDGDRIAVGTFKGRIRIRNGSSGALLAEVQTSAGGVNALCWSPQGDHLASAHGNHSAHIWDGELRTPLASLYGHLESVLSIAWSRGGENLVTGDSSGAVLIWDTTTKSVRSKITGETDEAWSISWSPRGACLVAGGPNGSLRIWNTGTGLLIPSPEMHGDMVRSVCWSPQGDRIAYARADGSMQVIEVDSGVIRTSNDDHAGAMTTVSWSTQSPHIASGSHDGNVRILDADSGNQLIRWKAHDEGVEAISWSPRGDQIASGSRNGIVRIWDSSTGTLLISLEGQGGIIESLSWSPRGSQVASSSSNASGDPNSSVCIWDTHTGDRRIVFRSADYGMWSVSWSPQGDRIALGCGDGFLRIFDADSGAVLSSHKHSRGGVVSVTWSPQGDRVASCDNGGTIFIFAQAADRLLATLHASDGHVLTSTPEGYVIAGDDRGERYALAAPNPRTPTSELYLPFAPLRQFFHRPDKVAALLRGERVDTTPLTDLVAAGWTLDDSWDGGIVRVPDEPPLLSTANTTSAPVARGDDENPFRPGPAIEREDALVGRARLLSDIEALVRSRQPAVIVGPRRSGKTSFITVYEQRLRREGRSVTRLSLEGETLETRDDLARLLCPELGTKRGAAARFIARFKTERDTVFLVDEIVQLTSMPARELAWVRKICQETASFVFAGSPWDWDLVLAHGASVPGSSLGNDVQPVTLGEIDAAEAVSFLTRAAPRDAPIPEETARHVVRECGAWPYYLQVMGWELVQRSRAGDRAAHNSAEALDRLLRDELPLRARAAFMSRWNELPQLARRALVNGSEPGQLSADARHLLTRTGLLLDDRGWLHDPPFFTWLRRNGKHLPVE